MNKLLVDEVLPICCAAYELAGGYTNNKKYEIAHIVKNTLIYPIEQYDQVPCCEVTETHRTFAAEIKEYLLKYLTLSVLGSGPDLLESWSDEYERKIYEILNNDVLLRKDISKLAKLPEYYVTFKAKNDIKKKTKFINTKSELSEDSVISDVECDVVHVIKTKNYPGYNITGIINECLVTWYSSYTIDTGHYKIEKAVIKEQQFSYYANKLAYRLNNVKGYLIK
jgi:hypothetical protein